MNEAYLKSQLMKRLNHKVSNSEAFRHEDVMTHGIPDISFTAGGWTSWWEAKYANPDLDSDGEQDLTLRRLARYGYARYIIFTVMKGADIPKAVYIVHPKHVASEKVTGNTTWKSFPELIIPKFNYDAVAEHIVRIHAQTKIVHL